MISGKRGKYFVDCATTPINDVRWLKGGGGWITKYINIKSTTVYVPSSKLGLSHPSLASEFTVLEKSLALCLLCGLDNVRVYYIGVVVRKGIHEKGSAR
jgi:hypothetical protein